MISIWEVERFMRNQAHIVKAVFKVDARSRFEHLKQLITGNTYYKKLEIVIMSSYYLDDLLDLLVLEDNHTQCLQLCVSYLLTKPSIHKLLPDNSINKNNKSYAAVL